MIPEKDMINQTKKNIIASIDVAMGGRAAEELLFGNEEITTGCSSDLNKATQLAYAFVKTFAMSEKLSLLSVNERSEISEKYKFCLIQKFKIF